MCYYSIIVNGKERIKLNNMKKLRLELGLTVRGLAKESKVAVGYISMLENDNLNKMNPSRDVMRRISAALNSTVVDVFF